MHIGECEEFGLTQEDMEKHEENQGMFCRDHTLIPEKGVDADFTTACTAYSRYILDVGQSQDWLALQIALLPCLLGYGMIGRRLKDLQTTNPPKEPNAYLTWINNYVADDYAEAVRTGRGMFKTSRTYVFTC